MPKKLYTWEEITSLTLIEDCEKPRWIDSWETPEETMEVTPPCQQTTGPGHVYRTRCIHCGASDDADDM